MKFGPVVGLALVASVSLSACNFNVTLPKEDPKLNALADQQFRDLVAGKDEAFVDRMSSANKPAEVKAQLATLRSLVPEGSPPKPQVIQYQMVTTNNGRSYIVVQDYGYTDRIAHVSTNLIAENDTWQVHGFNVNVTLKVMPSAAEQGREEVIPVV